MRAWRPSMPPERLEVVVPHVLEERRQAVAEALFLLVRVRPQRLGPEHPAAGRHEQLGRRLEHAIGVDAVEHERVDRRVDGLERPLAVMTRGLPEARVREHAVHEVLVGGEAERVRAVSNHDPEDLVARVGHARAIEADVDRARGLAAAARVAALEVERHRGRQEGGLEDHHLLDGGPRVGVLGDRDRHRALVALRLQLLDEDLDHAQVAVELDERALGNRSPVGAAVEAVPPVQRLVRHVREVRSLLAAPLVFVGREDRGLQLLFGLGVEMRSRFEIVCHGKGPPISGLRGQ